MDSPSIGKGIFGSPVAVGPSVEQFLKLNFGIVVKIAPFVEAGGFGVLEFTIDFIHAGIEDKDDAGYVGPQTFQMHFYNLQNDAIFVQFVLETDSFFVKAKQLIGYVI